MVIEVVLLPLVEETDLGDMDEQIEATLSQEQTRGEKYVWYHV